MTTTQTIDLAPIVRVAILGDLAGDDRVAEGPSYGRVGVEVTTTSWRDSVMCSTWWGTSIRVSAVQARAVDPLEMPERLGTWSVAWTAARRIGDTESSVASDPASLVVERLVAALLEGRAAAVDALDPRVGQVHEPYGDPLPMSPLWPAPSRPDAPCPPLRHSGRLADPRVGVGWGSSGVEASSLSTRAPRGAEPGGSDRGGS